MAARRNSSIVRYKRVAAHRRQALARGLIKAAVHLLTTHKANVGIGNPYPHMNSSTSGQFPRKRTGFGQAGYTMSPTDPREISQMLTPRVVVGVSEEAAYMEWLVARGRKGIKDTMEQTRARQRQIIDAEASK